MECQYYQHCAMFPNSLRLTQHHINDLQDYFIHCMADESTSLTLTVSVSIDVLKDWLAISKDLQCNGLGSASFFARLMSHFAHNQFLNFHGLPCTRLSMDQSVYAPVMSGPSILFRAISFILFLSPQNYLLALNKVYTDKTVVAKVWKVFIDKLNREWEEYTRLVRNHKLL
ncbi:hypothetical protein K438DRAFT_1788713 [Mycena galopus ATCC 62051]|nr:hypothetical protein K438DRAFT_1788713 [Mycena galopus ATCC 62051]